MRDLFILVISLAHHVLSQNQDFVLVLEAGTENTTFRYQGVQANIITDSEAFRFGLLPEANCIRLVPTNAKRPVSCYMRDPGDGSYYPPILKQLQVRSWYQLTLVKERYRGEQRVFLREEREKNCASKGDLEVEFNMSNLTVLDRISHKFERESWTNERSQAGLVDVPNKDLIHTKEPFDLKLKVDYRALGFDSELSYVHTLGSQEEKILLKTLETAGTFQVKLAPRTCTAAATFATARIIELQLYYLNDPIGRAAAVWEKRGIFWKDKYWFGVDVKYLHEKRFAYTERVRVVTHTGVKILFYTVEDCKCGFESEGGDEDIMP